MSNTETTIKSSRKPNIVFVLSDDLSYADIGCYGQQHIKTPNIDKWAAEGATCTEAYSAAPICGPSRCGLMTGKHMGHARIREHGQAIRGGRYQEILHKEDYTVGDVLKSAGYATACIGKWAIGIEGSDAIPNEKGFDYSFGFYDQEYAHTFYPEYVFEDGKPYPLSENHGFDMTKRYRYNSSKFDHSTPFDNEYDENGDIIIKEIADSKKAKNTYDLCEEKALQFIDNNKDKPFFLYYCVQNPHGPLIVPSISAYKDADFPSQRHKEWASIITRLDDGVGRISQIIDDYGLTDDTVFIFASDNGYSAWGYFGLTIKDEVPFFNHKGNMRGSKFSLDGEAGIKVPFVVKWRGKIAPDSKCKTPFAMYDLLATFADISGAETPTDTDGKSILSALSGDTTPVHDYLYWECNREQAARLGNFKAYRPHGKAHIQIFDLTNDPKEATDVAKAHPDIVRRAKTIFKEQHQDNPIFISPFESSLRHKLRLSRMHLTPNCMRADSPERKKWLEKFE